MKKEVKETHYSLASFFEKKQEDFNCLLMLAPEEIQNYEADDRLIVQLAVL